MDFSNFFSMKWLKTLNSLDFLALQMCVVPQLVDQWLVNLLQYVAQTFVWTHRNYPIVVVPSLFRQNMHWWQSNKLLAIIQNWFLPDLPLHIDLKVWKTNYDEIIFFRTIYAWENICSTNGRFFIRIFEYKLH